ncbi:MaoC/PaaZ C-terminal domain-containing protein [Streptomyces sp. MS1.AVA.4]|uniref:MaoC/PaaZ C-terminal domain-containing protein n=1 Tax=Streptomyces pratisoli TaxID=3139917 RepID=A0ACC6QKY5_9ACTN
METRTLSSPPALWPALLRGALASPVRRRRLRDDAAAPATRLVLAEAVVVPERLTAYTHECGFPGTGPLPITYPHVLGFPLAMRLMADRTFPLPVLGLVHTRIAITQHHRLLPTDRPEISVYTAGTAPHRRGTEVTLATEARLGGELVWESRSAYLSRHTRSADAPGAPSAPRTPLPPTAVRARWPLAADLGRRYGAASGDRNPIHLFAATARAFGFPRAVAHGMWTFARCLAEQPDPGGPRYAEAEFKAPVLLPGTVEYAVREDAGVFELRDPRDGRVHLTGRTATSAPPA